MANAPQFYRIDPDVVSEKLGGEIVLVQLETGKIHHTNETGSRVWELLQQGRSVDEILNILHGEYPASPTVVSRDVREFLDSLGREKMIEPVAETA